MRKGREWSGRTGRYGAAGESGAWRVAYEHYYWDRMREAYEAANELGAGHFGHGLVGFRQIEGEWTTRERGVVQRVNDWLQVEVIPEEVRDAAPGDARPPGAAREDVRPPGEVPQWLVEQIVSACDRVAKRFEFEHGPQVLLSVLSEESDVPWMPGRHGYCVDKHPYEKICIPGYSVDDPEDLDHVVQHEYAHVIALNLSSGRCPRWLDEAVAMVAGGGTERRAWRLLQSGRAEWKDEESLEAAYSEDREDSSGRDAVWMAYQQSSVIGLYLASLHGESGLSQALREHVPGSMAGELWVRAIGRSATEHALRQVYGFGVSEAFGRARDWLALGSWV
jgi:hypothetical protein